MDARLLILARPPRRPRPIQLLAVLVFQALLGVLALPLSLSLSLPLSLSAATAPLQLLPGPPPLTNHAATVLIFIQPDCPISNQYAPAINRLHQSFSSRDVAFFLIYPDTELTPEEVRTHVKEYRLACPAALDSDHQLVRKAGATITPEAAVFNRAGHRVYLGRIDNRYVAFGKKRPAPTREDLRLALESILAGHSVKPDKTRAIGCYIDTGIDTDRERP